MFRYLLALPDGQPVDPAVFVTAIPNVKVRESFMVAGGKQFGILAMSDDIEELEELYSRGSYGLWVVEPVKARVGRAVGSRGRRLGSCRVSSTTPQRPFGSSVRIRRQMSRLSETPCVDHSALSRASESSISAPARASSLVS